MTMLDEAKTNGHAEPATRAWDARLVAIERRLAAASPFEQGAAGPVG